MWFYYAKNNENTQMPLQQGLINYDIKCKVVIKLCKKHEISKSLLGERNMWVFSFKSREGFLLLRKKDKIRLYSH